MYGVDFKTISVSNIIITLTILVAVLLIQLY